MTEGVSDKAGDGSASPNIARKIVRSKTQIPCPMTVINPTTIKKANKNSMVFSKPPRQAPGPPQIPAKVSFMRNQDAGGWPKVRGGGRRFQDCAGFLADFGAQSNSVNCQL